VDDFSLRLETNGGKPLPAQTQLSSVTYSVHMKHNKIKINKIILKNKTKQVHVQPALSGLNRTLPAHAAGHGACSKSTAID